MKRLILGSGSPRRRELLAGLNLDFTVDKENNFDEGPEPGVDARRIPLDMAVGKSLGFHRPLGPDEVLLTADTVVIVWTAKCWANRIRVRKRPGCCICSRDAATKS